MSEVSNVEETLSPEEKKTKEIMRQSFRFSQESIGAQNSIFTWLAGRGHLKGLNIPNEPPEYILALQPPGKHSAVAESTRIKNIKASWQLLKLAADTPNITEAEVKESVDMLLLFMLKTDTIYQSQPRQGRTPSPNPEPDGIDDPHASWVRKFVINQSPTGTAAFDELLHTDLAQTLSKQLADPASLIHNRIQPLKTGWESNHNGLSFMPTPAK